MSDEIMFEFMKKYNIIVCIIADSQTGECTLFGNPKDLESDDILKQYFRDARLLRGYLEGRILPSMIQQGKVAGVLCKPSELAIVGILYHDERDVLQKYQHSLVLDQAIQTLWKT